MRHLILALAALLTPALASAQGVPVNGPIQEHVLDALFWIAAGVILLVLVLVVFALKRSGRAGLVALALLLPAVAEAQPALTLRKGAPVYFAPLGFAACQLGTSAGPASSPFNLAYPASLRCEASRREDRGLWLSLGPGDGGCTAAMRGRFLSNPQAAFRPMFPGGSLNTSAPGVCERLREWNAVGCGTLHTPPRQTCAEKGRTVWVWSGLFGQCPGRWILGGSRCGMASIEDAFKASYGRTWAGGDSEERLASLASCGVLLPGCVGGTGCPGAQPTAPPPVDPCSSGPPPPVCGDGTCDPGEDCPADCGAPPPSKPDIRVLGCSAGSWEVVIDGVTRAVQAPAEVSVDGVTVALPLCPTGGGCPEAAILDRACSEVQP